MNFKSTFGFVAAAVAIALALTSSPALAAACSDTVDTKLPALSNGFAFNLANTRNNPSQINSANVATLAPAISHAAKGSTEKRGAPAVTAQAVFLAAGRNIVAINRVTGCQYWSHTVPYKKSLFVDANAIRSSAVYYLNEGGGKPALVLAGDAYGSFYALNAVSGRLVWSAFIGTDAKHHWITGAPQFYNGRLYVPVATKEVLTTIVESTRCCASHGLLRAIDPYSGAILWTYETAPPPTVQTNGKQAPNGMSIWGTPAIDPARNAIYFGTGQNLTPPTTTNSDSIIALNLDDGAVKWIVQETAGDAFNVGCELSPPYDRDCVKPGGVDFDFGAPPILVRLASGADALVAGSKNGVVYSLNPADGNLNWSQRLGQGGKLGGVHWGMATDSRRVFVAISDVTADKSSAVGNESVSGNVHLVPGATPGLYALDLATGARLWEVHPKHSYQGALYDSIYSAAVTVTNDVLFAGSLDGVVKAFQTSDGRELWSYDTAVSFTDSAGVAGNGGTIDSVGAVAASSDLLINSGFDFFGEPNEYQAGPGNALLVLRLHGN